MRAEKRVRKNEGSFSALFLESVEVHLCVKENEEYLTKECFVAWMGKLCRQNFFYELGNLKNFEFSIVLCPVNDLLIVSILREKGISFVLLTCV